ncbi:MAG: acyltransferase family protein [bacterium]|nr:acyltransferase family protein [bacterium]
MNKSEFNKKPFSNMVYLAKGLGILFVVIGHYELPKIEPEYWVEIRKVLYSFHMPLFMMLAGYLFGFSKLKTISQKTYLEFLNKKFQRLCFPYITIAVSILALKYFAGIFFTLQHPITKNVWKYILLNPLEGFAPLLWFLYTLFIIFALYPLIKILVKKEIIILFITIMLSLLSWPKAFCLNLAFYNLPYFVFGVFIARHFSLETLNTSINTVWLLVSLIVFSIAYIGSEFLLTFNLISKLLVIVLAISGSIACIFLASIISQLKILSTLKVFGIYSATIYLLHTLTMGPIKILLSQILNLTKAYFLLTAIIVCSAGVFIPIIIDKYFIRPNPLILRFVLGVKANKTC